MPTVTALGWRTPCFYNNVGLYIELLLMHWCLYLLIFYTDDLMLLLNITSTKELTSGNSITFSFNRFAVSDSSSILHYCTKFPKSPRIQIQKWGGRGITKNQNAEVKREHINFLLKYRELLFITVSDAGLEHETAQRSIGTEGWGFRPAPASKSSVLLTFTAPVPLGQNWSSVKNSPF